VRARNLVGRDNSNICHSRGDVGEIPESLALPARFFGPVPSYKNESYK
jgi:hypothetical protein